MSVFHPSLFLGDGAFETLRTYGRGAFAVELHLSRLATTLRALGVPMPHDLADEIARARACVDGEALVRVIVPREGPRIVTAEPLPARASRAVALVEAPLGAVLGRKLTSYGESLAARRRARARGADDAVWTTPKGEWLEGATSSVVAAEGEALVVPPLSLGLLPGVTRKVVVDLARAFGLEVRERRLTRAVQARATEVMILSTLRGVLPVRRVGDRAWRVGPVARALREELARYAAAACNP